MFSLEFDSVYLISSSHISTPKKKNEMWPLVREIYSNTIGSTEWIWGGGGWLGVVYVRLVIIQLTLKT